MQLYECDLINTVRVPTFSKACSIYGGNPSVNSDGVNWRRLAALARKILVAQNPALFRKLHNQLLQVLVRVAQLQRRDIEPQSL
mmetsp:Transcript_26973/g.67705  ORF Transcript_26973/g.67705 Transcript_26973/m.67705 type:complete len:84 (-) Transcript_26973:63-314(-)